MNESIIREAFQKAKEDIFYLGEELQSLKREFLDLKTELKLISSFIEDIKLKNMQNEMSNLHKNIQNAHFQQTNQQTHTPTQETEQISTYNPTIQHIKPTETPVPTDTPTHPHEIGGLISPNTMVSIGNQGVPTDKPTDRQTDQQIPQHTHLSSTKHSVNHLDKASEILASLDSLKKEVRFKFKRLTNQEIQVFSLLYNLEESGTIVDYKTLANSLGLSESSIRDYIGKIQKKGIPIAKEKLNNKRILLHISPELKQIASLNTILQLREL